MLIAQINEKSVFIIVVSPRKHLRIKTKICSFYLFNNELPYVFLTAIIATSAGMWPHKRGFSYNFTIREDGSNRFSFAEYMPDLSVILACYSSRTKVESSGIGTLFFFPLYRLTSYSSFLKTNQKIGRSL